MIYNHVMIYNTEGNFLGYTILGDEALKLQTTNIYTEDEIEQLNERLAELNKNTQIRRAWPDARDPEVVALLDDPAFYPVEVGPTEVLDDEKSYIVYLKEGATSQDQDSVNVDEDASVLVYKTIMAPVRPSDVGQRIRKAQEQVARTRSGNLVQ